MDPALDPFAEPDPPPLASPLEAFRVAPCPVTVGQPLPQTKLIQLYGGPWDGAGVSVPAAFAHLATGGHAYHFHAETSARRGRETWVSCYVLAPQF